MPHGKDAARLCDGRAMRGFRAGDVLRDDASPAGAYVFTTGRVTLLAETPFGPHPVAALDAPQVLDLRSAFGGSPGVARIEPGDRAAGVFLPAAEARRLAFDPGEDGAAFRRLALASLTAAIRETNASLARFFGTTPASSLDAAKTHTIEADLDPERARDLFETAGIDPSILPALGLTARAVPPGAALARAGDPGGEAYILAEGKLRVSIDIAGAGEEALAIVKPGEIVGEMTLVDDAPRSADVFAHGGPAKVYVLTRDVFRGLMESGAPEGAPLLGGLTFLLARRLEEAIKKAAGFRILSGPI